MKALAFTLIFCSLAVASKAGDPYRDYLLSKIYLPAQTKVVTNPTSIPSVGTGAFIPRYETPRGAVFCRMEDKVTRATKVWLKLGVQ